MSIGGAVNRNLSYNLQEGIFQVRRLNCDLHIYLMFPYLNYSSDNGAKFHFLTGEHKVFQ